MASDTLEIVAPSRLHFGLLSFGQGHSRQFGGAGVMIDRPGMRLRIARAERFAAAGPLASRASRAAARFADARGLEAAPACRLEVLEVPAEHVGLGTGTQLELSVVTALNAFVGGGPLEPDELARIAGRANRSAVGTYGFVHGGLIVESGKLARDALAPLEQRIELPAHWCFVLVLPRDEQGLSGDEERRTFESLPPVPEATRTALQGILINELCPAAQRGDFRRFSESLYRYGFTSGMCFAARQGGAFATPRVAEIVAEVRKLGVEGVGQSSWGPTVFAVVDSALAAEGLRDRLQGELIEGEMIAITQVNNEGARIVASGP